MCGHASRHLASLHAVCGSAMLGQAVSGDSHFAVPLTIAVADTGNYSTRQTTDTQYCKTQRMTQQFNAGGLFVEQKVSGGWGRGVELM